MENDATIVVPVIKGTGTGEVLHTGTVAKTPGAAQPNLLIVAIAPAVALMVRFAHAFLTTWVGLIMGGMATDAIPARDFADLLLTTAALALAGPAIGFLKDLITIFGNLENKYPLLTGSV